MSRSPGGRSPIASPESPTALHALLTMPAAVVPMPTKIRSLVGHHDEMEGAGRDRRFAAWAHVGLAGGIRLDRRDRDLEVTPAEHRHPPRNPHATKATVIATAKTTKATSRTPFFCSRNGLKPMWSQ